MASRGKQRCADTTTASAVAKRNYEGGDLTHCIHRAHATDKACISERRELEVVEGIHSPRMEALGPLRSALARQHDPIPG